MMEQRSIQERLTLPALLLLALLARLIAVFVLRGDPLVFDSQVYLVMADRILDENPAASFPNGYPFLIAIFKAALPGSLEIPALLILNVLMGTATVGLTYMLARWLTTRPVALIVALVVAIYPHQVHYTRLIMTETLCTFLVTLAIFLLLYPTYGRKQSVEGESATRNIADDNTLIFFFFAGAILHYAAAVRPSVNLVLPIILLAGFAMRQSKRLLAVMTAGYLLSFGFFFGLEKMGFIRSPIATANNMLISINSDSRFVDFHEYSPEERSRAAQTYLDFARTNPGTFLILRAISFWELWGIWSLPGTKTENATPLVRLVVFLRFFLFLASLVAVWRYRKEFSTWILIAPALSITLLHIASFSNHRFIVPSEPVLLVLAGRIIADIRAKRPILENVTTNESGK